MRLYTFTNEDYLRCSVNVDQIVAIIGVGPKLTQICVATDLVYTLKAKHADVVLEILETKDDTESEAQP